MTAKSNKLKSILLIFAYLVLIMGLARLYFRLTDDFRLSNITHEMPFEERWQVPLLLNEEKELFDKIVSQNFYYIGKGAQAYAFGTEDGQYVIKFFKFKHLKPSWTVDLMPNLGPLKAYKEKQVIRKKRLLDSVFDGYRLGYAVNKEEAGIIFIHLNRDQSIQKTVTVYDKLGLKWPIDLDLVPFIIQKRVETTRNVFTNLLQKKDIEGAKKKIASLLALYLSEYQKGIYDRDHGVMHNTGFFKDQPIHLDLGKLSYDPAIKEKEKYIADLKLVISRMDKWVKNTFPEHYQELKEFWDAEIQKI